MAVTVLHSPNNKTTLRFFFDNGKLSYCAEVAGRTAVAPSPIGLITTEEDFTYGLDLIRETYGSVNETYTIPAFKKETCLDCCNTVDLLLSKNGKELLVQARAYDDGVAFRLQLLGHGDVAITSEECGFCMPEEAKNIYGMKLIMSYEDHYHPIPLEDIHQNAYAFPMLCELGGGKWALYAEAGVFGTYGGSNLLSTKESPRLLMTKKSNDKVSPITGVLPLATPWRVILTGSLADVVESNVLENLNPPSIVEDPSFIVPGRCAWSWMSENDSPADPQRQRDYVDGAAELGFEYSLDDGGWPGNVDIPELVKYAEAKAA